MVDNCQYAGTACDGGVRYSLLSVLTALTVHALYHSIKQYCCAGKTSTSKYVLPPVIVSEVFILGTVLSRFFLEMHSWVTSWLFIAAFVCLYLVELKVISTLLLRPVVFLKVHVSIAYRVTVAWYITWSLGIICVLIASNVELSLGETQLYQEIIGVFFVCFGIEILGFALLQLWTAKYLLDAMQKVNRQYDKFTKPSALQRRNLVLNARRMVRWIALASLLTAGVSMALGGIYLSLGVTGDASSGLWFCLILGMLWCQSVIAVFFGEPIHLFCMSSTPIMTTKQGNSSHRTRRSSFRSLEDADAFTVRDQKEPRDGHYLEKLVAKPNRDRIPDILNANESIYDKAGGKEAVEEIVNVFYDKMLADPRVAHFFGSSSMNILKKKQEMFFILMMGGPAVYTGKSLRQVHAKLNLDSDSFDIAALHMKEAMEECKLPAPYIEIVLARVNMFKSEVLGLVGTIDDDEIATA